MEIISNGTDTEIMPLGNGISNVHQVFGFVMFILCKRKVNFSYIEYFYLKNSLGILFFKGGLA